MEQRRQLARDFKGSWRETLCVTIMISLTWFQELMQVNLNSSQRLMLMQVIVVVFSAMYFHCKSTSHYTTLIMSSCFSRAFPRCRRNTLSSSAEGKFRNVSGSHWCVHSCVVCMVVLTIQSFLVVTYALATVLI